MKILLLLLFFREDDNFNLKLVNWAGENMINPAVKDDKNDFNYSCYKEPNELKSKNKVWDNYIGHEKCNHPQEEQPGNRKCLESKNVLTSTSNR